MHYKFMVREILESIASVRARAIQALKENNNTQYVERLKDISALEACLVIEATSLIDELDSVGYDSSKKAS